MSDDDLDDDNYEKRFMRYLQTHSEKRPRLAMLALAITGAVLIAVGVILVYRTVTGS